MEAAEALPDALTCTEAIRTGSASKEIRTHSNLSKKINGCEQKWSELKREFPDLTPGQIEVRYAHRDLEDTQMVLFNKAFKAGWFPECEEISFMSTGFSDAHLTNLVADLDGRMLQSLKSLDLSSNNIHAAGIQAFCAAIGRGAMANLAELFLQRNEIGDAGMAAFSAALGSGALPQLKVLGLGGNSIGDASMPAFATAIGSGALHQLTSLGLAGNQIKDGMSALAAAIGSGTMANLTKLHLGNNQIGDAGMTTFAAALGSGAFPGLQELWLNGNQVGDGMVAFGTAIGNGALPALEKLVVPDGCEKNAEIKAACAARQIELV